MERFQALAGPEGYYSQLADFGVPRVLGVALLRRSQLLLVVSARIVTAPLPARLTLEQASIYRHALAQVALERLQTAVRGLKRAEELLRNARQEKLQQLATEQRLKAEAQIHVLTSALQRQPN